MFKPPLLMQDGMNHAISNRYECTVGVKIYSYSSTYPLIIASHENSNNEFFLGKMQTKFMRPNLKIT
jgi:hypothetical protein